MSHEPPIQQPRPPPVPSRCPTPHHPTDPAGIHRHPPARRTRSISGIWRPTPRHHCGSPHPRGQLRVLSRPREFGLLGYPRGPFSILSLRGAAMVPWLVGLDEPQRSWFGAAGSCASIMHRRAGRRATRSPPTTRTGARARSRSSSSAVHSSRRLAASSGHPSSSSSTSMLRSSSGSRMSASTRSSAGLSNCGRARALTWAPSHGRSEVGRRWW